MIFLELGILLCTLFIAGALTRDYLNDARARLTELGMPLTLKNVFFIRAIKREKFLEQVKEDTILLQRELARERVAAMVEATEDALDARAIRSFDREAPRVPHDELMRELGLEHTLTKAESPSDATAAHNRAKEGIQE